MPKGIPKNGVNKGWFKSENNKCLGRKYSQETKEKMRTAKLKNPVRYWLGRKDKPPTMKGKHHSEKTKEKISNSKKGQKPWNTGKILHYSIWNKGIRGKDSHSWKGADKCVYKHYKTADYIEWRTKVFTRDDYTCLNCGARGVVLHPHHIKSYTNFPDSRYDIDNGVTLCVPCHHIVHLGH